jgi:hypothetical protein
MPCFPASLRQDNYGKDDEAAVQRVKDVYRELGLEQLFRSVQYIFCAGSDLLGGLCGMRLPDALTSLASRTPFDNGSRTVA